MFLAIFLFREFGFMLIVAFLLIYKSSECDLLLIEIFLGILIRFNVAKSNYELLATVNFISKETVSIDLTGLILDSFLGIMRQLVAIFES